MATRIDVKTSPDSHEEGEIDSDDVDENREVYCICRKSDTSRFMIGCDNCEEWYHGDCISITADYAKKIQKFFCLQCREKNPTLEIVFKEKKQPKKRVEAKVDTAEPQWEKTGRADSDYEPDVARGKSKYVESDDDDDDFDDDFEVSKRSAAKKAKPSRSARERSRATNKRVAKRRTHSARTASKSLDDSREKSRRGHRRGAKDASTEVSDGPRQCYGPGCTEVARKGSKYCSDECGLKLATSRIYDVLPDRIKQWQSTSSVADEFSQKELEKIRQEQQDARRVLGTHPYQCLFMFPY